MTQPVPQAPDAEPGETVPSSGRAIAVAGFATIIVMLGGFATWAGLAPLDGGAIASGRITVDGNMKAVQHLEGGIVEEIIVRDGDFVEQGSVLVRLDATRARASLDTIRANLDAERAVAARLLAERDGLQELKVPESFKGRLESPKVSQILDSQRNLMQARRETLGGQVEILQQRIGQLEEEQSGLAVQVEAMDKQLVLIKEELKGLNQLFEKGFVERPRILALEREAARLEGVRGANLATIARTKKAVGETKLQIIQLRQGFREEVLTQYRDVETRIFELTERAETAQHVLDHIEIRAPNDGVVAEMAVHTVGGVIRPGDTVLKLVPTDDDLLIEAQVQPIDIDNVATGQEAQITLSAFSQRTTPTLNGTVTFVSADSLVNSTTGEAFYLARVTVSDEEVARLEDKELLPGMPAEIMIKTGTRTPAEYLMQPLTETIRRAWRED